MDSQKIVTMYEYLKYLDDNSQLDMWGRDMMELINAEYDLAKQDLMEGA